MSNKEFIIKVLITTLIFGVILYLTYLIKY